METNVTGLLMISESSITLTGQKVIIVSWTLGIVVSILGSLLQLFSLASVPAARNYEQRVLTHLTLARCTNVIAEYLIMTSQPEKPVELFFQFLMTFHTDLWVICWLLIFTKNLYDKSQESKHLGWAEVYAFGVVFPALVASVPATCAVAVRGRYFVMAYVAYVVLKVSLTVINLIMFCIVIKVRFTKFRYNGQTEQRLRPNSDNDRNSTSVVSLIVMSIICCQILCADLVSILDGKNDFLVYSFCVANSYQVLLMSGIFLMMMKRNTKNMKIQKKRMTLLLLIKR